MILVHQSPTTLRREHGGAHNLGVMSSPRRFYRDAHEQGFQWCADNDSFNGWDEAAFVTMLAALAGVPGCLFVVAPDVVGDAVATLERFGAWFAPIRDSGQPVAFVAQDGVAETAVPWDQIDALFIGGTTAFKFSEAAANVAAEARARHKWLHMGRVNSHRRIRWARALGCQSIDGTTFSRYRRVSLPSGLHAASAEQLWPAPEARL